MARELFDPLLSDIKGYSDWKGTKFSGNRYSDLVRITVDEEPAPCKLSSVLEARLNAILEHPDFWILDAHVNGGLTLEFIALQEGCDTATISRRLKAMRESLTEKCKGWETLFTGINSLRKVEDDGDDDVAGACARLKPKTPRDGARSKVSVTA